jgi:hypothetical protein
VVAGKSKRVLADAVEGDANALELELGVDVGEEDLSKAARLVVGKTLFSAGVEAADVGISIVMLQ